MLVAFVYQKEKIVTLMTEYAGEPFCTYQGIKRVKIDVDYGSQCDIEMENGDSAVIRPDILEVKVN